MSSALECQSLSHYSDFETGSESGLSEFSLVRPYQPKKFGKRSKSVPDPSRRVNKRGARATRRYENEAFLNSLSAIAETDAEELATVAWPDSISHCSAFVKLFEDDSIRAVWDLFIKLSETEQERLLRSLRRSDKEFDSSDSDSDNCLSDDETRGARRLTQSSVDRLHAVSSQRRRSKRGQRRKSKNRISFNSSCKEHNIDVGDNPLEGGDSSEVMSFGDAQAELRGSLPPRFLSLLSKSHVPRGRRARRMRRCITPLDFCLIDRVESELRRWFAVQPTEGDTIASWIDQKRWTPTVSLLGEVNLHDWMVDNEAFPDLIQLDAFERLLVHSVATYLGLVSYSNWSESLSDRQLWVEKRFDRSFTPPKHTLVNLLKVHFTQP